MGVYEDVMTVEDGAESEEDYFLSIQRMINAGQWSLQGSFGRTMMDAINSGRCMLGEESSRDYYGNYIPSRTEVKEGTKGSRQYVVDAYGEDWADMMENAGNTDDA